LFHPVIELDFSMQSTHRLFLALLLAGGLTHFSTLSHAEESSGLSAILIPGEDWQVVADNLGFADGCSADTDGNFYFCDMKGKPAAIYKIAPDGTKTQVTQASMSGTKIGADGKLYACGGGKLISVDLSDGKQTVITTDLKTNDIAINKAGLLFMTETGKKQVTFIDIKTGQAKPADVGINKPNGIGFCPNPNSLDKNVLLVSDFGGLNVWSFTVNPDGTLTDKKPWATMKAPEKKPEIAGGDGMCLDSAGRAYVTTALGLQIFDADGKLLGILPKPQENKPLVNAAFAGKDLGYLYIANGDKVFRRKTQVKGAVGYQSPVRPDRN
jgi:enterochelin esterase family protein